MTVESLMAIIQRAEQVTGNVAMTCRYNGISRPTYYTWLRTRPRAREDYDKHRCRHVGLNGQAPYERLRQKTQTQP